MRIAALVTAIIQGLIAIAFLAILQVVLQIWSPKFALPFNVWWGMLLCIPGLMMTSMMRRR